MSGGVNQVEDIVLSILCPIIEPHSAGLDGNTPLPLDIHVVQELVFHLPHRDSLGFLQNPVSQRGLPVVDVGDDTEIADVFTVIWQKSSPQYSNSADD